LPVLPTTDPENPPSDSLVESWMSIEVDLVTDPVRARELNRGLVTVCCTTCARWSRTPT